VPARDSAEYGAWVEAICGLLPPAPADVLDIATGTGFVAVIAAGMGHRVTAIDVSDEMLDEARRRSADHGVRVTFAQRDAIDTGLPLASFDAVISRHFIWTLREPVAAFREWRRLLRPGGRVIAIDGFWFPPPATGEAVPGDEGPPGLFEEHYTEETRAALPAMHMTDTGPLVEMLRQAGFSDVRVSDLADVHAVAEEPPSTNPWYAVTAARK
jgi:ubiquinone/menaquinone biosynthesis C-methylase UbiE